MVKQSSRRKFSILQFIKDFSIFGVLWGEFLFHLLGCLCQGCGESEFLDMGMISSKYSSESGCISLLGIDPSGVLGLVLFYYSKIS